MGKKARLTIEEIKQLVKILREEKKKRKKNHVKKTVVKSTSSAGSFGANVFSNSNPPATIVIRDQQQQPPANNAQQQLLQPHQDINQLVKSHVARNLYQPFQELNTVYNDFNNRLERLEYQPNDDMFDRTDGEGAFGATGGDENFISQMEEDPTVEKIHTEEMLNDPIREEEKKDDKIHTEENPVIQKMENPNALVLHAFKQFVYDVRNRKTFLTPTNLHDDVDSNENLTEDDENNKNDHASLHSLKYGTPKRSKDITFDEIYTDKETRKFEIENPNHKEQQTSPNFSNRDNDANNLINLSKNKSLTREKSKEYYLQACQLTGVEPDQDVLDKVIPFSINKATRDVLNDFLGVDKTAKTKRK